uniref:Uncharacterized protein n=1 Tax=Candidatus Kentrum sp. TUN TaxID=2126343 RepID=A0A451AV91_9GAMM|nr:MAG: hypothetical protein BECKTUN1418F_GA0071002_12197 [Candidatus Kentron sp. TUN]VFK69971.1 MAG: hypothetical protein BECKTUN1418E_GA0071001_12247 [Candidatus Kentron sp. TUN]
MNDEFQIRLTGGGIKLDIIRPTDLAEILTSIETIISAEADKKIAVEDGNKPLITLDSINKGSIAFIFKATSLVISIFIGTAQAIEQNNFSGLNKKTIKSLSDISSVTRKYNCSAELSSAEHGILARITPNTNISHPFLIEGGSEIFGKVMRVGGKEPRVMVKLFDGSYIYCDLSGKTAEDLGSLLYKHVTLI